MEGQNSALHFLSRYWKLKQFWLLVAREKIFSVTFLLLATVIYGNPAFLFFFFPPKLTVTLLSAVVKAEHFLSHADSFHRSRLFYLIFMETS